MRSSPDNIVEQGRGKSLPQHTTTTCSTMEIKLVATAAGASRVRSLSGQRYRVRMAGERGRKSRFRHPPRREALAGDDPQIASCPGRRYRRSVPVVQYPWDPQLVSVRRAVCPNARWNKARRAWAMTDEEADMFLKAAHRCMVLGRSSCTVGIDSVDWVIGFVEGAPFRR